ncbi:metallophosphoesterase family protein [Vogesella indigofera]|uniref:metallophosphoesterase family protein n=1 Tax=Vogesella indigofera TaxID=45465 RepID=UPI00234EF8AC|nr:metallophosphoesterase family protein [Vogesella indigofera]MDC7708147.1 metallophosphoesterase family protein [Vogesella indigofera]
MLPDRFAVLTDIHGNLPALQAVLADMHDRGVRHAVNLGDILSGPLWPAETADLLMGLNLPSIAGNHERQLLACQQSPGAPSDQYAFDQTSPLQRAWLASLPGALRLGDVQLTHGSPYSDLQYLLDDIVAANLVPASRETVAQRLGQTSATLVLCGHSHMPRLLQLPDGPLLLNPGSVGLPAYDDSDGGYHRVQTGAPHASYAIAERVAAGWQVQLLRIAYDWQQAAQRAADNGRPDWAAWLQSGMAT